MCLFPLAYYKLFPAFSTVAMTCRGVLFCVVSPVWGASASVGGELSAILKLHTITYVFTSPMSSNHPNPALSLVLILSSDDGHLGSFLILPIANNTSINMGAK